MLRIIAALSCFLAPGMAGLPGPTQTATLPQFDFTKTADVQGWQPVHDISRLTPTDEGLRIAISGADPYLHGPPRDYPAGTGLWLKLRLKSDQGGMCQVFFFPEGQGAVESNSVRFYVPAGKWWEGRAVVPPLGPRHRLRIDPPGGSGNCLIATLVFAERRPIVAPAWPKPEVPQTRANDPAVQSGDLRIIHAREGIGAFAVFVGGERMAVGNSSALMGYVEGDAARWVSWRSATGVRIQTSPDGLTVTASCLDPDGGEWRIRQQFEAGKVPGSITVETRVSVSRDRQVAYLPLLTLFAGLGNFGTNKTQALFAGVEYLENEPSSAQADLRGPAAQRQVPDTLKLTLPLSVICAQEKYLGLTWEPAARCAAFFDSPDRLYHSGGQVLGLLFPGSDGTNRDESSLLPHGTELLRAETPLVLRATIMGGPGRTVVPALEKFVALRGLPRPPAPGFRAGEFLALAAGGWLDSKIREDNLYRHAVWPGFGAQAAADSALWMDWLAARLRGGGLSARLTSAAQDALRPVARPQYHAAAIGHIRYPAPALVYGATLENVAAARAHGRDLVRRFQPDGTVLYEKPARGLDYGSTHYARHANGLTAQAVLALLEAATFSGDRELLAEGLKQLRGLARYRGGVPRGAQTWEIPLHTPDILASAHLVRACTLGHELTGETGLLDEAKYWAWTGVPFVYLSAPTDQPIGLYSTIPVLGATGWVAPVWIGLPVQWCGLVYAEALYGLATLDRAGPWKQIADGITVAGMQMTWPTDDRERQGLLPDIFLLRTQQRDGPAINPATVLAPALRFWDQPAIYDFHAFRHEGYLVHAPGAIEVLPKRGSGVCFQINGWSRQPYQILVNGVRQRPKVKVNGAPFPEALPHFQYGETDGQLILQLKGKATVEIMPNSARQASGR